jgi:transposase
MVMIETEIFGLALGVKGTPWEVVDVKLDTEAARLDIHLDFPPGTRFARRGDGQLCPVYDTSQKTWRHLNFFQYECFVHAWVPRIDGGPVEGVQLVEVPWARPGCGFTLLMEAMVVMMCQTGMTVAEAARMVGENAHRLWRVLFRQVARAHQQIDVQEVRQLTVDETSVRRGHDYVTVVCEPAQKRRGRRQAKPTRVLFVAEGRDADTLGQTKEFLEARGAKAEQVREICTDMSPAYIKGLKDHFPDARVVFDYFHIVGLITKALDEIRRRESREFPHLLKGTRYLWLKREENLSPEQSEKRFELCRYNLKTAKAYCHLSAFQDLLSVRKIEEAVSGLKWWYNWVCHSRIPDMIKVAKSIKEHWDGVVAYLETRLTNGPAEAINGIIQTVKRKCRGFRNFLYFRTMIYLVASKLKFDLPSPIPGHPHETS